MPCSNTYGKFVCLEIFGGISILPETKNFYADAAFLKYWCQYLLKIWIK
jgi:hypothetical protein